MKERVEDKKKLNKLFEKNTKKFKNENLFFNKNKLIFLKLQ